MSQPQQKQLIRLYSYYSQAIRQPDKAPLRTALQPVHAVGGGAHGRAEDHRGGERAPG